MLKIKQLPVGDLQTNCYLLEKDKHVIIIDPGSEASKIIETVGDLKVEAILLTHGHFDHIEAVAELIDYFQCDYYVSKKDFMLIKNPNLSYQRQNFIEKRPVLIHEEGNLKINNFEFEVFFTPGHTAGSVLYRIDQCLFTGDTLFKSSIGRTDFATGDHQAMKNSLNLIKQLPKNLIVYPGHGPQTDLETEFKTNPYLQ